MPSESDSTLTSEHPPKMNLHAAQRRFLVDFDGVLFPYSKGYFDGTLYEGPIEGAAVNLVRLVQAGYTYVVFTTRMELTRDPEAEAAMIGGWLAPHGFPSPEQITATKLPCLAIIDDRAVRFTDWDDLRKLWM